MGGSSSKRRGKPRAQTHCDYQGNPIPSYVPDQSGDYSRQESWYNSGNDIFVPDTHENVGSSFGIDDSYDVSNLSRTPPPPYSEFDLLSHPTPIVSAQTSASANAGLSRAKSIPNLMDLDPGIMEDVLQSEASWNTFTGASDNGNDLDMSSSATSSSPSDFLSHNQNMNQGNKNAVKSKKSSRGKKPSGMSKNPSGMPKKPSGMSKKPSGMSKKPFYGSVPDFNHAFSEFQSPDAEPANGAGSRRKPKGAKSNVPLTRGLSKTSVISQEQLQALSQKNDRLTLFTLQNFNTGFISLLNETDYSDEVVVLVLDLLAKVCANEDCPNMANSLLQTALYTKLFNVRMVTYLRNAPYNGSIDQDPTLLKNLLIVFTTVLREFKKEAESKLGQCLHLGRQAINQLIGPSGDLDDDMIRELRVLTDVQTANKERFPTPNVASVDSFPGVFHIDHQPLPEIKIKNDTDYKIQQFNMVQNEFNDSLKFLLEESDVYRNVRVIGTECSWSHGLMYKLSFEAANQEVSWIESIKLLEGSTIFLARGFQEDLHCATVVRRSPGELSAGYVWVKLLDRKSTILNSTDPLVMSENFTYKDDFISVMESLQLQKEHPMPFSGFIVGMKTKLSYPKYLTPNSSITFPFTTGTSIDSAKKFNALNPAVWPTANAFNFDGPFYEALKHALTKELALIHCPPGSDSFGFGHCVLQMLLHNETLWHTSSSPILLLFETDEALDMFLVRVLAKPPTGKLIRIGGPSKNADLLGYDLGQSRNIVCTTKMIPSHVIGRRRTLYDKMAKIKIEIASQRLTLEKSKKHLLKVTTLKNFINEVHFDQLMLQGSATEDPFLKWLFGSYCSPHELQSLLNEYSSIDQETKAATENMSKKSTKDKDLSYEELLSQLEMNRRVLTSETSDFDDLERVFTKRTTAANVQPDSFIPETLLKKNPIGLIQGKKAYFSDMIANELRKTDVLNRAAMNSVVDVISMKLEDRWNLYRYWLEAFTMHTRVELKKMEDKYEKFFCQMQEVVREIDVSILQQTKLLGMTMAAAAKHHHLLKIVAPRIVIVHDAGRIPECKVVASLTEDCQHLILLGDHHQIKPVINKFCSLGNRDHPVSTSLFGKLIEKGIKYAQLTNTFPMGIAVVDMLVGLFNDLPIYEMNTSLQPNGSINGVCSDVFFMNSSNPEIINNSVFGGHLNEHEAKFSVMMSKYLVKQGYKQSQITILATTLAQVHLLMKLTKNHGLHQVECHVVEDFLGNTNDIVLLSLVRSTDSDDLGHLADKSYVYMALSRARLGLYCIGNIKMLMSKIDIWKHYVTYLAHHQLYGSNLMLKCKEHPNEIHSVGSFKILQKTVSGFCKQICSAVLECGHQCNKPCHGDDVKHNTGKCNLPCLRAVCPAGHKCPKKCFEKCPPCEVVIQKVRPCLHKSSVKCSTSKTDNFCNEKCKKVLLCGHPCPKKCGEKCDDRDCGEVVECKSSPCKHVFFVKCCQRIEENMEKYCPMPCHERLACGHICQGACGKCNRGRMHVPCQEKCKLLLICGHKCQNLCGADCTPCKKRCGYSCDHVQCTSDCGTFCIPCCEPCAWQCIHHKCSKMCFEVCDRQPCNYPCPRLLPCKHQCIGFCGDSCPSLCRICDRTKLLDNMIDQKLIDISSFVLLEDCNHVMEARAMDVLMQNEVIVEAKTCPKCGVPIKKNLRYGNVIKKTNADVARVTTMYQQEMSGSRPAIENVRTLINLLPETPFAAAVRQLKAEALGSLTARDSIVLENKYRFIQIMFVLWKALSQLESIERFDSHQKLLILEHLHKELKLTCIQDAIRNFVCELKRVIYLLHLYKICRSLPLQCSAARNLYVSLLKRLSGSSTFKAVDEAMVVNELKAFQKSCNVPQVRVEDLGNVQVSSIWQMSAGHWSKDKKGQYSFNE